MRRRNPREGDAMTTLREAALEAWEPSDTAHRPGGLPQDFTKIGRAHV
jgi:hypothetical protein